MPPWVRGQGGLAETVRHRPRGHPGEPTGHVVTGGGAMGLVDTWGGKPTGCTVTRGEPRGHVDTWGEPTGHAVTQGRTSR